MSYKLFLDDERVPAQVKWVEMPLGPWVIVRSYKEFVSHISEHGIPNFIAYDNDLADEHYAKQINDGTFVEKTGYDCAKWMVDYCLDNNLPHPQFVAHTMNPVGRKCISHLINNYNKNRE